VGLLGAWPAPERPSSLALLAWLAICAPTVGWLAGTSSLRLSSALVIPGTWMVLFALLEAGALGASVGLGVPSPVGAATAWTGLFVLAAALGRAWGRARWRGAGIIALVTAACVGLASGGGLLAEPWPAEWGARLLDLSPVTFVLESAGLADWMWHPAVYAPVGVDRFARTAYDASLAGPLVLLVGCVAAAAAAVEARRRVRRLASAAAYAR